MQGYGEDTTIAVVDHQPLHIANMPELVRRIIARAQLGRGFTLFTLNLDHLVKRRRDAAFRAAYSRATMVTADGWPVAVVARRQHRGVERVTGADLILPLCEAAAEHALPIFLFGSTEDSLSRAAAVLTDRFPGIDIRGMEAPPMGFDPQSPAALAFGEKIATSGARLCLVALGAPKQEIFADAMAQRFPGVGFLCVGAAVDFVSGHQRRAPTLIQRLGVEWLWRLAGNPRRMALRYGSCALVFFELCMRLPIGRIS